jgi:hypothetical protein
MLRHPSSRLRLFEVFVIVVVIVGIFAPLGWATWHAFSDFSEKIASDVFRAHDVLAAPVQMDELQVNTNATFVNNGFWNRTEVVIGQQIGGAVTGLDSTFISHSPNGGCIGNGCNDNAEWHDAISVASQGAGPQVQWFVITGPSHAEGIASVEKVTKHNGTASDSGGDFNLFLQAQNIRGGGMNRGFTVDANLHVNFATEALSPTSCGTGPSLQGGDAFFFGTTGTGATACTIPWVIPYDSFAPGCLVLCTNGACAPTWIESTTSLTITFGSSGTWAIRVWCAGGV